MEKSIKRRTCRLWYQSGTFFKIFVVVCFVLLLAVGCASAATIVVNQTSPANTSGDFYCGTIKESLNMAEDGDTIIVCPGIYKENIVIDTSVCIQSYGGASDTIVEAKDVNDEVITITANKVNLSGFTIRNSEGDGIFLNDADDCNLSGNNIYSTRNGICLFLSDGNKICHNTPNLNNNDGIFLESSNNNLILNNIANTNKQYHGIELYSSKDNLISDNNASNNYYQGIRLISSSGTTISNNTLKSNGNNGIYLNGSSYNTIKNNKAISSLNYHGISVDSNCNHNIIIGNNASNNMLTGVYLFESRNNTIIGNIVNKNMGGIVLIWANKNELRNNSACENSDEGLKIQDSEENLVTHNSLSTNLGGIVLMLGVL